MPNKITLHKTPESNFSWKNFVSGGVSGLTALAVGQPFDIVKTRMQTQGKMYKNSNILCAKNLLRKEGILAFYKGAGPMVLTTTPAYALQFYGFSHGKQIFGENGYFGKKGFFDNRVLNYGLAGSFTAFYVTPLYSVSERIKCVAQTTNKYGKNDWEVLKNLYKNNGFRNLIIGWEVTFLRSFVGNAFYFGCYDYWKEAYLIRNKVTELPMEMSMFYGGLTGWAYWLVVMPIDTCKSMIQVSEKNSKDTMIDILGKVRRNGFIKILYRGFGPALGRAFPAHAACFLGYEKTKQILDRYF